MAKVMQFNETRSIFNGRYIIYNDGRIYSNLTHKFLRTKITPFGYESIGLYISPGNYKWFFIHRLVTMAFLGKLLKGLQVNHKDGKKLNNHISNLEYMTQSENAKHSYRLGLQDKKGEKHHLAIITEMIVKEVRSYLFQGVRGVHIAKFFNISQQLVCDIKKGRRWGHVI